MATEISKITEDMLIGKGVTGLPDAPELSTLEMQEKFDELSIDVIIPHINQMCDEIDAAVDGAASTAHSEVLAETSRAQTAEGTLSDTITAETNRATTAEGDLSTAIGAEKIRAEGAEGDLSTAINNEKLRAQGIEGNLSDAIAAEKSRAELAEGTETTRATGVENAIKSGYECLTGLIEITSDHKSLNYYTTPGNYYKKDQTFSVTSCPLDLNTDIAMFRMRVSKVSDEMIVQTIYDTNISYKYMSRWYIFDDSTQSWVWGAWCTLANKNGYLDQFSSVTFNDIQAGQVVKSVGTNRFLENDYLKNCAYDEGVLLRTMVGSANGLATLDSNGKIPQAELPSLAVGDYICAYGVTDIASREDLHIQSFGDYYFLGTVYNHFSDLPSDIDSSNYKGLLLTVREIERNNRYYVIHELIVINPTDGITKKYIRNVYESALTGDVTYSDWTPLTNPQYLSGEQYDADYTLSEKIDATVGTITAAQWSDVQDILS